MTLFQRTIQKTVSFSGIALHSGDLVHVQIRPAAANTGIVFQRTDLPGQPFIASTPDQVFDTSLATRVGSSQVFVSTIEHLMGAFFGFGIDNAIVAVDNAELPILDGSSAPFLLLLDEAGCQELTVPRKVIQILKTIEVVDASNPSRFIRVEPSKTARITYAIDFAQASAIGRQQISLPFNAKSFCEEFAYARTFCLQEEIDYMRSKGLAKGGSLKNAVVVSRTAGLMNENGLRNSLEFVKHKALDCMGDLHMLGMGIIGHVVAHKAGHDLHNQLARAILAQESSRQILVPSAKDLSLASFKELFAFPNSLADISQNLVSLASG